MKITPEHILIYISTSTILKSHQESFILEQILIKTEIQNWSIQKIRHFRMLSPTREVCIIFLPSRFRDLCIREGRNIFRARDCDRMSKICTSFKHTKTQTEFKGKTDRQTHGRQTDRQRWKVRHKVERLGNQMCGQRGGQDIIRVEEMRNITKIKLYEILSK